MLDFDLPITELRNMVRISSDALDNELNTLQEAFLLDIERAGVQTIPEDTALVESCLRLYLRWQENYNGEADRYMRNYMLLRNALAQAREYKKAGGA